MNSKVFLWILAFYCAYFPMNESLAQNNSVQCEVSYNSIEEAQYAAALQLSQNYSGFSNFSNLPQNATLPIYVWVNRTSLDLVSSVYEINHAIENVNTYFNFPNNVRFKLCGVSYINDSRFYSLPIDNNTLHTAMYNEYHKENVINVYMPESLNANFARSSFTAIPFVAIQQLKYDYDVIKFAHELGHTFNLFHTHNNPAFERELVIREPVQGKLEPNWGSAADKLKETPADVDNCHMLLPSSIMCLYIPCNTYDANNDRYVPDITNIMSNYIGCTNQFIPRQQIHMNMVLDMYRSNLLNTPCNNNLQMVGTLFRAPECNSIGDDTPIHVKNAQLQITDVNNNLICSPMTNSQGYYTTCDLPKNSTVKVIPPAINTNPKNGVDSKDISIIARHILGTEYITEPFKLIAADVDNSGEIDGLDLWYLQHFIVTNNPTMPNNVNSWRFVPDYFLSQPSFLSQFNQNPFNASYQGYCYSSNSCNSYMDKVTLDLSAEESWKTSSWTFRPFKVGDVDCSAKANQMSASPIYEIPEEYTFSLRYNNSSYQLRTQSNDISLRNNNERILALKVKNEVDISSFQMGLGFSKSKVFIKSLEKGDFNSTNDVFDFTKTDNNGQIRALWFDKRGAEKHISAGTVLLKIAVKANANIDNILKAINIDDNILPTKFFNNSSSKAIPIDLEWEIMEGSMANNNLIVNSFPNPFSNDISFEITSPTDEQATISIRNTVTGQSMSLSRRLHQGVNVININNTASLSPGMLTYSVISGSLIANGSITKTR